MEVFAASRVTVAVAVGGAVVFMVAVAVAVVFAVGIEGMAVVAVAISRSTEVGAVMLPGWRYSRSGVSCSRSRSQPYSYWCSRSWSGVWPRSGSWSGWQSCSWSGESLPRSRSAGRKRSEP